MYEYVYNNITDYNPRRSRKVLIVFDGMIADIMTNKKFQAVTKDLYIRCMQLNILLVFITKSYFLFQKKLNYLNTLLNNEDL